jgi:quercetin dioxygenase-like cupin family protein
MSEKALSEVYASMMTDLPKADIPFEGVEGWLFQGRDHQIVFFDIQPVGKVAPHSHGAQWGIVIEGEMTLTIDNQTRIYRKGDYYNIPAGVSHSAEFNTRTRVMDFFEDRERYQPLPGKG